MSDFIDFATAITRGLAKSYTEDVDVFLLFTGGGLLATRSEPLRAIGKTLFLFTCFRRSDQYISALERALAPRPRPENWNTGITVNE